MKVSKRKIVQAAGVVVVRKENGQYLFLLLKSGSHNDFPKGRLNEGETKFEAALRETEEESSITPEELDFKWGKVSIETKPYGKGKVATYFLAETKRKEIALPINPELGKAEHDSWKWMTYDEAMKATVPRLQQVTKWAWEIMK